MVVEVLNVVVTWMTGVSLSRDVTLSESRIRTAYIIVLCVNVAS